MRPSARQVNSSSQSLQRSLQPAGTAVLWAIELFRWPHGRDQSCHLEARPAHLRLVVNCPLSGKLGQMAT